MIWDLWFTNLLELPAEAPEWSKAQEFVDTFMEIAALKLDERTNSGRRKLGIALHELITETGDMLRKFQFIDCADWVAEAAPLKENPDLAERVDRFRAKLESRRRLGIDALPGEATIHEEVARRQTLRALEEDIESEFCALNAMFSNARPVTSDGAVAHVKLVSEGPSHMGPSAEFGNSSLHLNTAPLSAPDPSTEGHRTGEPPEAEEPETSNSTVLFSAGHDTACSGESPHSPSSTACLPLVDATDGMLAETAFEIIAPHGSMNVDADSEPLEHWPTDGHSLTVPQDVRQPGTPLSNQLRVDVANRPQSLAVKAPKPTGELRVRYRTAPRTALPELSLVAKDVQTDNSPEAWGRLVWALIASDDLTGAYWLSLWRGHNSPVQAWLVAAVQGARWLSGPGDPLAYDLFELLAQTNNEDLNPLLKLSLGLYPSLVAPESGTPEFLRDVPAEFSRIASAVAQFAAHGIPLQFTEVAKSIEDGPASPDRLKDVSARAEKWLKESASFGSKYAPAIKVWRALNLSDGPLHQLLLPVSRNDRSALNFVRHELRTWSVNGRAADRIQQVLRAECGGTKTMVGSALQRLLRETSDAARIAKDWCDLVDEDQPSISLENIAESRVADLRSEIQAGISEAELALSHLQVPLVPLSVAASAHCVERALAQICEALKIQHKFLNKSFAEWESRPSSDTEECTLESSLRRRLWLLPEIATHDGSALDERRSEEMSEALRNQVAEGRPLEAAFHLWLDLQDFRNARHILDEIEGTQAFRNLMDRYEDLLERSRTQLSLILDCAREQVEQGMLDGYIYEDRAEFLSVLASIDPGSVQDFPGTSRLVEQIRDQLTTLRDSRIEHIMERWHLLQPELVKRKDVDTEDKEAIFAFIQSNFDKKDSRVLDECVSRVAEVLATEGDVKGVVGRLGWFAPAPNRDVLSEFVGVSDSLAQFLETFGISSVLEALKRNRQPLEQFGIVFPEGERREDVITALSQWNKVKESRQIHADACEAIAPVIHFLGFQYRGSGGSVVKVLDRGPDWMLVNARYRAVDTAPIPQFGSEAEEGYHVLCVWRKAPPGRMKEILKEGSILKQLNLERRALIVFYLGFRSDAERNEVASLTRQKGYALAVLDENLLLFLAGKTDNRTKSLLRCSLPFSALVPYTPNRRGDVAEEMFVGREKMIRDIWSPDEGCIVYGGRQLGKTTIQHRVVDIYHHPDREQFAWWEPMAKLFEPTAGRTGENIWLMFADRMKQTGMTVKQHTSGRIADQIVAHLGQHPTLRVLVMLDEADEFLDADATADFREVRKIRDVMDHTNRRFKVVFTGNRKVQRFQAVQDNPLVHFGTPILVGPLEPEAARELVRRPLAMLGYRMDDETVLRVLSYTNYHAVCIHQFGEALLRRMRGRTAVKMPEQINRADVESAYSDKSVREVIREVFINTLSLEDDYLVITLAMIRDQSIVRDSFSRSYTASELYILSKEAWPQGFEPDELDVFRLRLDEMCGLGVLVKNSTGGYFLRSPNMVRMVCADGTVDSELARMQTRVRQPKIDIEVNHAPMNGVYSPLTYAQEKALNCRQTGVSLIFASEALGISELPPVFRRLIPSRLPDEVQTDCSEIPSSIQDPEEFKLWLRAYLSSHANHERLVLWHRLDAAHAMERWVRTAIDFCQGHPSEKRWLRIHLALDPAAAWNWCLLPSVTREDLENRCDAVITTRKWRLQGIRRRLEQQDQPATEEICSQVFDATGGWHMLLNALPIETSPNPGIAAKQISKALGDPDSAILVDFRNGLGLGASELANKLFTFLSATGDLPSDYLSPVLLSEYGFEKDSDCENALRFLQITGCADVEADIVRIDPLVRRITDASSPYQPRILSAPKPTQSV